MKKALSLAFLLMMTIALAACSKTKGGIIKESKLKNYTLTVTVKNETNRVIKKDGYEYEVLKGENTTYIRDFGTTAYVYNTEKDSKDEKKTYVTSTVTTDYDLSSLENGLLALTKNDVEGANGAYSLKNVKNNGLVSVVSGTVMLDERTYAKEAYDSGLVTPTATDLKVSKGMVDSFSVTYTYAGETTVIEAKFTEIGSTKVELPTEGNTEKAYAAKLDSDGILITLNFKGVGKITLKTFSYTATDDVNAINYFVYLLKKGAYKNTKVSAASQTGIQFGANKNEKAVSDTIKASTSKTVSNLRGTLAFMFKDSNSLATAELILNAGSNSAKDGTYVPVAGIVEGFEVLDQLAAMTKEEYSKVKVSVKVKYNSYKYAKPTLA